MFCPPRPAPPRPPFAIRPVFATTSGRARFHAAIGPLSLPGGCWQDESIDKAGAAWARDVGWNLSRESASRLTHMAAVRHVLPTPDRHIHSSRVQVNQATIVKTEKLTHDTMEIVFRCD